MKKNWMFLRHDPGRFKKMWLMSKLTLICMLLGIFQLHARSQSVSLNLKNATLKEVIWAIENQTRFVFMYSKDDLDRAEKISIKLKNEPVEEILQKCLKGSGLTYVIQDEVIVLRPRAESAATDKVRIVGRVSDRNGQPLPGVTVLLKGTMLGVVTDGEGRFQIEIPETDSVVLVFSFVGMKKLEILYTGEKEMNVKLEEEVSEMDEVVVTGIFTKARESYTGAVTTITSKELKKFGNRSVISQIRNIDPSFNILENNTYGSDPNRLPDIQMRGSTSLEVGVKDLQSDMKTSSATNLPLFILDGFEITLQRVLDMDENMIESVTLLKDASATAMYGSRGANGVVVITTSRPEAGKIRLTYKGDLNIEAPDFTSYNLLNAREKVAYEKAAGIYDKGTPYDLQRLQEIYNKRMVDIERGVDTYWLKYPVRTGIGHRHSLRIDGGDENFRYAANVGYNNVAGVMKESERETISGNMFFSYRFKKVSFQNDLTLTVNKARNSPYGVFSDYTVLNSYWKPYEDDGTLKKIIEDQNWPNGIGTGERTLYIYNPLYNATLPSKDTKEYFNVQNNFAIEWDILPGLVARGRLTFTKQTGRSDKYLCAEHTSFAEYTGEDYARRGSYRYGTSYDFSYEADFTCSYSRVIGEKHQLYAGLSYNFEQEKSENHEMTAEGFSAINMDFIGMANSFQKNGKPLSSEGISRRLGGIANLNYTFDRRYFIDFSGKLEGSSKFGSDKRLAPFWSVGMGWNIHHENFIKNKELWNSLRLRFSYGVTGSQDFSPYQAMTTFAFYSKENYRNWIGSYVMGMGNKELGWQQTRQMNIGLETILFNGAVKLNADYYHKMTDDLLSDINLPTASGFNSYKANVGKVRNQGIELTANVYLWRDTEREITWSAGGSLAHNQNKIRKISNSLEFLNQELLANAGVNPSFLFEEGQSMNTIFAVKSLGIDPSNGKEIFLKKDGTKTYTWDAKDEVACGINEPKVWGNLNTMFRFKGLSLNLVFGYRLGGYIYNSTLISKVENVDPRFNADKRVFYDRWKEPGNVAYFKNIQEVSNTKATSRFVMKENTLECRSVNLSYDFNAKWLQKRLNMSFLSLGVYTEDVFRISTIKQERGTSYPFARKYSVSLTARF